MPSRLFQPRTQVSSGANKFVGGGKMIAVKRTLVKRASTKKTTIKRASTKKK